MASFLQSITTAAATAAEAVPLTPSRLLRRLIPVATVEEEAAVAVEAGTRAAGAVATEAAVDRVSGMDHVYSIQRGF